MAAIDQVLVSNSGKYLIKKLNPKINDCSRSIKLGDSDMNIFYMREEGENMSTGRRNSFRPSI